MVDLTEALTFQLCPECQGSREQHDPFPKKPVDQLRKQLC